MKKYHYTYYSYEEWGRGYIGKGSCNCNPEEELTYFGSYKDKTFEPTQKIILGVYTTPTEAIAAEIKLQNFFQVVPNPHFANQVYQTSTKFRGTSETARKGRASMTPEQRSEAARKAREVYHTKSTPEQRSEAARKGQASRTPEQRSDISRKANQILTPEQRSERARKGQASRTPEQRSDISRRGHASRTPEQRSEIARKRDASMTTEQRSERSRKGQASKTLEQRKEGMRKARSQMFQCSVTGHITNAGSLSNYQKARGIDTANRIKLY